MNTGKHAESIDRLCKANDVIPDHDNLGGTLTTLMDRRKMLGANMSAELAENNADGIVDTLMRETFPQDKFFGNAAEEVHNASGTSDVDEHPEHRSLRGDAGHMLPTTMILSVGLILCGTALCDIVHRFLM